MVGFSEAYAASTAGSSSWVMLGEIAPFVLVGLVFYFLVLRPQNKQRALLQGQLQHLGVGAKVICRGGYFAMVVSVERDVLGLQLSPGNIMYAARGSVEKVFSATDDKLFPTSLITEKKGETPTPKKNSKKAT